MSRFVAIRDLG